jgi:hypothetical protein
MANKFLNTINIPKMLFGVLRDLKAQKKFISKNVSPLLHQFETINDGSLSEKDFQKINNYYGLAVPAILGEAFCMLRGFAMNELERLTSTSQGVVTGLFDDFFDDGNISENEILKMLEEPRLYKWKNTGEKLIISFYNKAIENALNPDKVKEGAMNVFKAQQMSIEQEDSSINQLRVWEITQQKGGESVLFYRYGFKHRLKDGEEEALFQLGSLMQLENDIFDVYKDSQSGIYTLPIITDNIEELKKLYTEQVNIFIELCYKMDYPKESVKLFLDRLMPVINRAYVCFRNYKKLEKNNKNVFDVPAFTRKQLICDMEKLGNFLRTVSYQINSKY